MRIGSRIWRSTSQAVHPCSSARHGEPVSSPSVFAENFRADRIVSCPSTAAATRIEPATSTADNECRQYRGGIDGSARRNSLRTREKWLVLSACQTKAISSGRPLFERPLGEFPKRRADAQPHTGSRARASWNSFFSSAIFQNLRWDGGTKTQAGLKLGRIPRDRCTTLPAALTLRSVPLHLCRKPDICRIDLGNQRLLRSILKDAITVSG